MPSGQLELVHELNDYKNNHSNWIICSILSIIRLLQYAKLSV